MSDTNGIFLGLGGGEKQYLNLARVNRHGLIAGATGTGKTVTVQGLCESFSAAGVPVFVADVKGDLSGVGMPGSPTFKHHDKLIERAEEIGYEGYGYSDNPVIFWDLYGEKGHPIRTTISEMGPLLLGRLMELTDAQQGVLEIAFRYADDEGLLLLELEDLQSMMVHVAENSKELTNKYGNVSKQSVGAIQRKILQLDSQGANEFFGEPALDIQDFFLKDDQGRGYVNVLAADKLMASPKLYGTFLLWMMSELFEQLPEVGDPDKPNLVFFFDEAHLLFEDAPKVLEDKIEQVVRLIRSKGIGVFFITQNPIDIPEDVAGQLGNRVQHALRAFTPRDQRAIKAAAETFRINEDLDVEEAITELRVGEALVSTLDEDGAPSIVQRTLIKPPRSRLGPLNDKERAIIQSISPCDEKYDEEIDRESAEEVLAARAEAAVAAQQAANAEEEAERAAAKQAKAEAKARAAEARANARPRRRSNRQSVGEAAIKSVTRSVSSSVGRQIGNRIVRGLLGGIFGGR